MIDETDTAGNYETGESFTGPRDYFPLYLESLKQIPPMSAAEEADLIDRWRRFKDMKARERVITASLHLVSPIARRQARKFKLDTASTANKNRAKSLGRPMQDGSGFSELVGEGNLALVRAFDAFPPRSNVRFEHYARRCISNAIVRHAVSLLSVVHRPWGERVTQDIIIDPTLPDMIEAEEDTGCRRARPTQGMPEGTSNFSVMRSPPSRIELPWILQARVDGMKLKEIAEELEVSIATAWRREKAAIQKLRDHHNGTSHNRGITRDKTPPRNVGVSPRDERPGCNPLSN